MIEILLTIGVPLLAGLILTFLRAIANQKKLSMETTQDAALDMTFLAIGASGGVFNDAGVKSMLGPSAIAGLLGLIFFDLLIASVLLYLRRFSFPLTPLKAFVNFSLGALTLLLVAGVIYGGTLNW
jgi:hypothetical protein